MRKKIATFILFTTSTLFANNIGLNDSIREENISEEKAQKILIDMWQNGKTTNIPSSIVLKKAPLKNTKTLEKKIILEDKTLTNDDVNQIFLSFYQEWQEKQRIAEEALRNKVSTSDNTPVQNINKNTPLSSVPTLAQQMEDFRKTLLADENSTTYEDEEEQIEEIEIFGTSCYEKSCKLITEQGYRKVGEKVNGKIIKKIDRFNVYFNDNSKISFISL